MKKRFLLNELVIKPTYACNAGCFLCKDRKDLYKDNTRGIKKLMKIKEHKKLVKEAAYLKINRIIISGGEPTLYLPLIDLIKECKRYGITTLLITNGSNIDEVKARQILDSKLDTIIFSIDHYQTDMHDYIRQYKGLWNKSIGAIKRFNRLKKETRSMLSIDLTCIITKLNYARLEKMIDLVKELNVNSINFSYVEGAYNKRFLLGKEDIRLFKKRVVPAMIKRAEGLDWDDVMKGKLIKDLKNLYNTRSNSLENFEKGIYWEDNSIHYRCKNAHSFALVLANGDVHPCNMIEYSHEPIIGNLFKNSFVEIWNGKKHRDFVESEYKWCRCCPVCINTYSQIL